MTEMIGLGERTGNVDNTLKALGDYYEKQARMRESVKKRRDLSGGFAGYDAACSGCSGDKSASGFCRRIRSDGRVNACAGPCDYGGGRRSGNPLVYCGGCCCVDRYWRHRDFPYAVHAGKGIFQKDEGKNCRCAYGTGACHGNAKRHGHVGGAGGGKGG